MSRLVYLHVCYSRKGRLGNRFLQRRCVTFAIYPRVLFLDFLRFARTAGGRICGSYSEKEAGEHEWRVVKILTCIPQAVAASCNNRSVSLHNLV